MPKSFRPTAPSGLAAPEPLRFGARPDEAVAAPPPLLDRLVRHFVHLASGPEGPERLVESSDAVLATLRKAAEAQMWPGVLELARAAEPAFALAARWGAWGEVLEDALEASRALSDRATEGWALHQLGIRAVAQGEQETARALLSEALGVRSEADTPEAAAATAAQLSRIGAGQSG